MNNTEPTEEEVLQSLKRKGVIDEIIIDGQAYYKINDLGVAAVMHFNSDPKTRN
jgi:hypothetical protein